MRVDRVKRRLRIFVYTFFSTVLTKIYDLFSLRFSENSNFRQTHPPSAHVLYNPRSDSQRTANQREISACSREKQRSVAKKIIHRVPDSSLKRRGERLGDTPRERGTRGGNVFREEFFQASDLAKNSSRSRWPWRGKANVGFGFSEPLGDRSRTLGCKWRPSGETRRGRANLSVL